MLKYLSIAAATAIINLVLVSTSSAQIASDRAVSIQSMSSQAQDKLIAKDEEQLAHINANQQSDVQGIHKALTQFFKGLNEGSVERMARVSVSTSASEKEYLRNVFSRLKASHVDVSVEIQNIDLVSLSTNNALVKIEQLITAKGAQRSGIVRQSSSVALIKNRGQWKISDGSTVIKSVSSDR
jgi:hypothetical protein